MDGLELQLILTVHSHTGHLKLGIFNKSANMANHIELQSAVWVA